MQVPLSPEIQYDFSKMSTLSIAQGNELAQPLLKIKNNDEWLEKRSDRLDKCLQIWDIRQYRHLKI